MRPSLVALVLAGLGLAGCRGATEPRAGIDYQQLPADYVVTQVKHFLTEDGVRRGILNADTAFFYADSAEVSLRDVHLQLYKATGEPAADLVSRTGELNQRTNAMVARGNVVLVSKNGNQKIETQELHYDPNSHRVWSTVEATITQNGTRTTTDGFTADDQLLNIQMSHTRGRVEGMKVTF